MKKKILLIVLSSFLLTGVVSAASLWGSYKGYAIIKVNVDGKQYTTKGVPPISVNGQVMLPLNILKQVGIQYTYDSKKQTANIETPVIQPPAPSVNLNLLKEYVVLLDYYASLKQLGDKFTQVQTTLGANLTIIINSPNPQSILDSSYKALDGLIAEYNRLQKFENNILNDARSYGIHDTAIDQALVGYSDAIDTYKAALEVMRNFQNNSNFVDDFFDELDIGLKLYTNTLALLYSGYNKYWDLVQSFTADSNTVNIPIVDTTPQIVVPQVVESKIDGEFEGFENGKVFKLFNGQIWEQVDYTFNYTYKYSPDVTIYQDGNNYMMIVSGVDKKVKVKRIK